MTFEAHRMPDKYPTPQTSQTFAKGKILDRKYLIEEVLGCGGMSIVYKAKHLGFDRTVALKFLTCIINEPGAVERFKREAIVLDQLKHPNIIELVGWGLLQRRPYIAMEWVDGKSLAQTLDSLPNHRLSALEATPIFLQICDALGHAHSKGVIHRDLNPSNVMLTAQRQVKLIDFGIARLTDAAGASMSTLTSTGTIIGSLPYTSPEQCTGRPPDARSDIYSMGCLMYEVLTGAPPFTSDNANTLLMQHVQEKPKHHAALDGWLGDIVMSALAKDPSARIESAERLRQLIVDQAAPQKRRISSLSLCAGLLCIISAILVVAASCAFASLCETQNRVQQLKDRYESLHNRYHDSLASAIAQCNQGADPTVNLDNALKALLLAPDTSNQETPDEYVTTIAWQVVYHTRSSLFDQLWRLGSYLLEQPELPRTLEYTKARQQLEQKEFYLAPGKRAINWELSFLEHRFHSLLNRPTPNAGTASALRFYALELSRQYHKLGRLDEEIAVLQQAVSLCENTSHRTTVGPDFGPALAELQLDLARAYVARAKTTGQADLEKARVCRDSCIATCKRWQSTLPTMTSDRVAVNLDRKSLHLHNSPKFVLELNQQVMSFQKQANALLLN
jgi:serine/threonine protein kinase